MAGKVNQSAHDYKSVNCYVIFILHFKTLTQTDIVEMQLADDYKKQSHYRPEQAQRVPGG